MRPDRTALVELTFFANEGGRGAGESPYISVRGLFTNQRGWVEGHSRRRAEGQGGPA
jgi:hypothetical protein